MEDDLKHEREVVIERFVAGIAPVSIATAAADPIIKTSLPRCSIGIPTTSPLFV